MDAPSFLERSVFLLCLLIMHLLIWNCRGALSPNFHSIVNDMVRAHSPAIMILTETKVGGERAKCIVDRLPFDGVICANTLGLSGGLWVIWDSAQVEVSELSTMEQEIHTVVTPRHSNTQWLLSAVYAGPRYAERRLLWENLESVASLHSLPWIIAGDFNDVLMGEDKFGGSPININRALRFQECLDSCGMIDIGFSGAQFTWSNQRPVTHLIQERIDRVFVNAEWYDRYPEACVSHLDRSHSDHCPILLSLEGNCGLMLPRPFRFQPMWLSHPSFPDVVREAWTRPINLPQAVSKFTVQAKIWNKNVFGNLFRRKKRVTARLKGIQVALAANPNDFLVKLERDLRSEFAEVSKLKEEFWALKSWITWLVERDRNTGFYHTSALVRRRRNRISSIKDRVGNWIHDDRDVADYIRLCFADLYTSSHSHSVLASWNPPFWQS